MSTLPAQAIAAAADRQFYIDMTVLDLVSFDGTTTIDVYGQVETSKWAIGRLKGDTTAPGDLGPSQRNIQWKKETGSFTGFDQTTGSLFQKAHALGSQWLMNCEDAADTGDKWQLLIDITNVETSRGKEATKDTMNFDILGVPFFGPGGATPVALPL